MRASVFRFVDLTLSKRKQKCKIEDVSDFRIELTTLSINPILARTLKTDTYLLSRKEQLGDLMVALGHGQSILEVEYVC